MKRLEESIRYHFSDRSLLLRALTRSAYAREQGDQGGMHMDALAVLGDAAISLWVIERIITSGEHDKGVITSRKMHAVDLLSLRRAAESHHLVSYVFWGKGEKIQEIWRSGRVQAECFEALIGAIYLDGGMAGIDSVLQLSGVGGTGKD